MAHRSNRFLVAAGAALLVGLLGWPGHANAQAELWQTHFQDPLVSVRNHAREIVQEFRNPGGVCHGPGLLSPDQRSYFLPSDAGLARFDVVTRQLAEVVPGLAGCNFGFAVSPSGRWWYQYRASSTWGFRVIDAISKSVVQELPSTELRLRRISFSADGTRRLELRLIQLVPTRYALRALADGPGTTVLWERPFPEGTDVEYAASAAGLFIVTRNGTDPVTLSRVDVETGADTGSAVVDLPATSYATIAATSQRVVVAGQAALARLVVFDAATLAVTGTHDQGIEGVIQALVVHKGSDTGYVTAHVSNPVIRGDNTWIHSFRLTPPVLSPISTWHAYDVPAALVVAQTSPAAPRITALSAGNGRVSVTWIPGAEGAAPRGYVIGGGLRGLPSPLFELSAETRSWTFEGIPPGEYTLEISGRSLAVGPLVRVDIAVDPPGQASAPANLVATAAASAVRLTWDTPATGPLPASYIVEAAPQGGPLMAVARTTLRELVVPVAPLGTWQVQVRGVTPAGAGQASAAVTLTSASCSIAPGDVTGLAAMNSGSAVSLAWTAPPPGVAARYRIEVGSAAGLSDLVVFEVDGQRTWLETTAPPGIYVVRVRAANDCGLGTASNEVIVRVP